jgi:hypothetical protein
MTDHADAVPVDLPARFGRSDHVFLRMVESHLPLIDELLTAFDAEGLKALARRLPFHRKAWLVVIPECNPAFAVRLDLRAVVVTSQLSRHRRGRLLRRRRARDVVA